MSRAMPLKAYLPTEFTLTEFAGRARIADVGCGAGRILLELQRLGHDAIGIEVDPDRLEKCIAQGLHAVQGTAESLPLEDASCDGVVCNVVIPYTDEATAIGEWARVLVPGGEVRAVYHGSGFALHLLLLGPGWKYRAYGLRMIANTWLYRITGRRMPGWLGDSLYQSRGRLRRYYRQHGLVLIDDPAATGFCGLPVFICHRLRKPAHASAG